MARGDSCAYHPPMCRASNALVHEALLPMLHAHASESKNIRGEDFMKVFSRDVVERTQSSRCQRLLRAYSCFRSPHLLPSLLSLTHSLASRCTYSPTTMVKSYGMQQLETFLLLLLRNGTQLSFRSLSSSSSSLLLLLVCVPCNNNNGQRVEWNSLAAAAAATK
jgi:hypothetical protein